MSDQPHTSNELLPLRNGKEALPPTQGELESAVKTLLLGIGENPEREGLIDTPRRVVKALREMTAGEQENPQLILGRAFEENHSNPVTVGPIRFTSLCEHHLLPFVGEAFVSYVPHGRVVGLSKIPRLVKCFARRLQLQERLTDQIASAMFIHTGALGVAVRIQAHHSCMGCRGVEQPDAQMITTAFLGSFCNPDFRREFFEDARAGWRTRS